MRVLITNNTLAERAGTELYVRDLALGLLRRGHTPIAYSTDLGEVAEEIRAAGIAVFDNLDDIETPPDVIHGQHHLDAMTALLHFPEVPALYMCHGAIPWVELPPRFPRILRYVAVDRACLDRLLFEGRIPEAQTRVLLNFVDLERFKSRPPLPAQPRRALFFSNHITPQDSVPEVQKACDRAGLMLDLFGMNVGKVCAEPEVLLRNYDIVFAKGRAALEALAVGAAVILCDVKGAGPMVNVQNVKQLRPLNFGLRTLEAPVTVPALMREIARYDAADAAQVSEFIRTDAGIETVLDEMISLYEEILVEYGNAPHDADAERRAAALYLRELSPQFKTLLTKEDNLASILRSRSFRLCRSLGTTTRRFLLPAKNILRALPRRHPTSNGRPSAGEVVTSDAKRVFSEIYRQRAWGSNESVSGPGSTVARAQMFKDELAALLTRIKVTSVLDAGCGDFNWIKEVNLDSVRYVGIDVVSEIITVNQRKYGKDSRTFANLDITSDQLPQVDVILCRDSLVHLSLRDIFATLENFERSGSIYLLTTTFVDYRNNEDIRTGGWRRLNLEHEPFNFPPPIAVIDEQCKHTGGIYVDKRLALWALKDVPHVGFR